MSVRVGVLALQGGVDEHLDALARAGGQAVPVRTPVELEGVAALVIPGGESTTVMKLLARIGLIEPIVARVAAGMPLWGTCMGAIVAARDVAGLAQPTLGVLDVTVRRNAFGRQNESAEVPIDIPALGIERFPAVFIRAPWIERTGPGVEVLARRGERIVMVRQGNVLATAFHPELSADTRIHRFFVDATEASRAVPGKRSDAA